MAKGNLIGDRISEEQFLEAYNRHLPNKWIEFAFRYFSQSTKQEDKYVSRIVSGILITLFVLGFIGTMFNFSRTFMWATMIPFIFILFGVVVLMFGGAIMNNLRIRKICKELGITHLEYDLLAAFYL
jgi:hypothetical protein